MKKIYVLDTSVVLHNWNVLTEERTMVMPQLVLDEIEKFKDEPGDLGDNARNASWWLSQKLNMCDGNTIGFDKTEILLWQENDEKTHDQKILRVASEVSKDQRFFDDEVVILTKSVALRVKARIRNEGYSAEDYDDVGLVKEIDGWKHEEITADEMQSIPFDKKIKTFHLDGREKLVVNEYIQCTCQGEICNGMIYRHIGNGDFAKIDLKPHMAGVVPKNAGQIMLADALLNPDIPLVTAIGSAGSGKTLLAMSAGIQQVMMKPKTYKKIIITRPIMPIGKDIGYLPGDVYDKMEEWIRPFMNNIEVIQDIQEKRSHAKTAEEKVGIFLDPKNCEEIEVLPLTYIRGSSISNAFIIVDEAQNATPSEMKTIITRVGEGSKLVLLGDIDQIDNRYLSRECNGITMAIKKFWGHDLYAHVTLDTVERSKLAELATKVLF